nr:RNA-directed DNA polymerase, eukaryota, reverse transcriptase zinc-binding domain protein [Tanacetum cinerariifolium]
MEFIQKKVGNGENTSFCYDSWLGEVALKVLYKRLYSLEMCKSISVAEKMVHPSLSHSFRMMPRGGVKQKNYGLLCTKVADLVLSNISDRWCWSLEDSQEFLIKSSRILIDYTILRKAEFPTRWLRVVPIKVNVNAWRVCLDKLPTRANLSLRGMDIPSIACPLFETSPDLTPDNADFLTIFITKANKRNQIFMLETRKHGNLHPKKLLSIIPFFIKPPSINVNQLTGPQELSLVFLIKITSADDILISKVVGGGYYVFKGDFEVKKVIVIG